ncbi:UDP-glucose 4-epimerase [Clostridia bacterium]|nr:UDP-glucose 4-epimerase [Clostridia bacterium]
MKALVAGGAGFIGSHLCDALIQENWDVVCVDNFFIGTEKNIEHLRSHPKFAFHNQDICALEEMKRIFAVEQIDYVFHLAANSDIQSSAKNPIVEYQNTYTTTFNLCECMRLSGAKKLFFASTSAVYGEKEGEAVAEDCPNLSPVSYYGATKLGSEAVISAYSAMNDIAVLVFRFPNVIGPRLTHGVIFDFIKKLNNNPKELEILGDGKQSKPYMYVADLVDAIIGFKDVSSGVITYNIGVETQTNVSAIADIVCEGLGLKDVKYNYTGGRGGWLGDVPVFAYNLDKIHAKGWNARFESDDAVRQTLHEVLK